MQTNPTAPEPPGEGGNHNPQGSPANPATNPAVKRASTSARAGTSGERAPSTTLGAIQAGPLAVLGTAAATIAGSGLYATAGTPGLIAAGAASAVGGVGYAMSRRKARQRFGRKVYPKRGERGLLAGTTRKPGSGMAGRSGASFGTAGGARRTAGGASGGGFGGALRPGSSLRRASRTLNPSGSGTGGGGRTTAGRSSSSTGRASTTPSTGTGRTSTPRTTRGGGIGRAFGRRTTGASPRTTAGGTGSAPAASARRTAQRTTGRTGGNGSGGFGGALLGGAAVTAARSPRARRAARRMTQAARAWWHGAPPADVRAIARGTKGVRIRPKPAVQRVRRAAAATTRGVRRMWRTSQLGPILTAGWRGTTASPDPTPNPPAKPEAKPTAKSEAKPYRVPGHPTDCKCDDCVDGVPYDFDGVRQRIQAEVLKERREEAARDNARILAEDKARSAATVTDRDTPNAPTRAARPVHPDAARGETEASKAGDGNVDHQPQDGHYGPIPPGHNLVRPNVRGHQPTATNPTTGPTGPAPKGGTTMNAPAAAAQVDQAATVLASVDCQSLVEIERFFIGIASAMSSLHTALKTVSSNLASGSPTHQSVDELAATVAAYQGRVAQESQRLQPLLRAANADDFRRIEQPRNGEWKADHTVNRQAI